MQGLDLEGKWVMITGASSGLGKDMAIYLAKKYRTNLIIVARRQEKLLELKQLLESQYQVKVEVQTADMSRKEDLDRLYNIVTNEFDIYGIVLNAGVTFLGKDTDMTEPQMESIINTNVNAMATFIHRFSTYFEQTNKEGSLLLVASMAALFPAPYQSLYSGTKGFISNYATALSRELTNKSFSISVFAPGGIKTEMTASDTFSQLSSWLMSSELAAQKAIEGWVKRKLYIIPGFSNSIGARFMRLIPRSVLLGQMAKVYRKALFYNKN